MTLESTLEFSYTVKIDHALDVGKTPAGRRLIYNVRGGEVTGDRLRGEILPGGADWMLIANDGWGKLDVRAQMRTHDGALIYISYIGIMELTDEVKRAPHGLETSFEDLYFRCSPKLETGDPRYAWVNQTFFVSRGRMTEGPGIEYMVYRIH